jgi:hypothetical protein
MSGTQFVCTWLDRGPSNTTPTVKGRFFDNDGTADGGEFNLSQASYSNTLCSTDTTTPCPFPFAFKAGGFGVTFSGASGTTGQEVWTRLYSATGDPVGNDLQANQFLAGAQDQAACDTFPLGHYVCVWTSENQDGSSDGVVVRMLNE